jgi:hypothetical protein
MGQTGLKLERKRTNVQVIWIESNQMVAAPERGTEQALASKQSYGTVLGFDSETTQTRHHKARAAAKQDMCGGSRRRKCNRIAEPWTVAAARVTTFPLSILIYIPFENNV